MFDRILIANRGEIACRVARTARRLGIESVCVHSDADSGALHVELADLAVGIGGLSAADSYLRGDRIIEAALATGAQAIHPGYGFLSENPDFARDVAKAGLVFIGPSAESIEAMGLKDRARHAMHEAGVPVVPGYDGGEQEPGALLAHARDIGFPLMIKAVAGGGGRGMRSVESEGEFARSLEAASAEALSAFGDGRVLLERRIVKPRHIEVQVFGDSFGSVVHLFERDCSLQRRNQKVIEEAPAPGMDEATREAMCEAAVKAARSVNYVGAGTVELIADVSSGLSPDRFYFMEMNTRLQVEHPVTEEITGVDLVEWQLRVAAGEALPLRQDQIRMSGHSFEARIYAEDVAGGFAAVSGTLDHVEFPSGARVETGVRRGDEISPWYDSMIAKLVTSGRTRGAALRKLSRALSETRISGAVSNVSFLESLCRLEPFVSGDVHTGLIEGGLDSLAARPAPRRDAVAFAALLAGGHLDGGQAHEGFFLWSPLVRTVTLRHFGDVHEAGVETLGGGRFAVWLDGEAVSAERRGDRWLIGGILMKIGGLRREGSVTVFSGGAHDFEVDDPLARGGDSAEAVDVVAAPMPGQIKLVFVSEGDRIGQGGELVALEAMKMEHTLRSPRETVVEEVFVKAGEQVESGTPLVRLRESGDD